MCSNLPEHQVQSARTMLWSPYWWDSDKEFERKLHNMERQMDRMLNRFPSQLHLRRPWYYDDESPTVQEWLRIANPIVKDEDGIKKFRLAFDLRRFRPEEVSVETKGSVVTINAKHESKEGDHSKRFEFHQQFSVPEGVNAQEVKCRYMNDGSILLEAPYTEPEKKAVEAPKEQEIAVKHQ